MWTGAERSVQHAHLLFINMVTVLQRWFLDQIWPIHTHAKDTSGLFLYSRCMNSDYEVYFGVLQVQTAL